MKKAYTKPRTTVLALDYPQMIAESPIEVKDSTKTGTVDAADGWSHSRIWGNELWESPDKK